MDNQSGSVLAFPKVQILFLNHAFLHFMPCVLEITSILRQKTVENSNDSTPPQKRPKLRDSKGA
jgi:hypothetical protein